MLRYDAAPAMTNLGDTPAAFNLIGGQFPWTPKPTSTVAA
jgi:hypothetical protein